MRYSPPALFEKASWEDVPASIQEAIRDGKSVFITGGAGTGKTHISWGIVSRRGNGSQPGFINAAEMLDEIRSSFDHPALSPVEELSREDRLVVIDDLGAERMNDWTGEQFYRVINARYENKLQTVFTSNLGIEEIAEKYGDRIASRMAGMCRIVQVGGVDRRLAGGNPQISPIH